MGCRIYLANLIHNSQHPDHPAGNNHDVQSGFESLSLKLAGEDGSNVIWNFNKVDRCKYLGIYKLNEVILQIKDVP